MTRRSPVTIGFAAALVIGTASFALAATVAVPQQQRQAVDPGASEAFPNAWTAGRYVGGAPNGNGAYLARKVGRSRTVGNDGLTVALVGKRAGEKESEYADSLSGGPDYWEVTGIVSGSLNLRDRPSSRARIMNQFSTGAVLKNLGCMNRQGRRWCNVELPDDPSARGWVNGRYLRESSGPK